MKPKAKVVFYSLTAAAALQQYLALSTADPLILLFLLLGWFLFSRTVTMKHNWVGRTTGGLFTVALLLGKLNDFVRNASLFDTSVLIRMLICAAGLFVLLSHIVCLLQQRLSQVSFRRRDAGACYPGRVFGLSVLVMLLAWTPVFLVNYPGVLSLDSYRQFSQAMGETPLHSAHPIAHTLIIRLLCSFGLWLTGGDLNGAIAVYSVVQAVLMACTFAYLLSTMEHFRLRRGVIAAVLAVYAIIPYHSVYSITMWKDVLFAASVLALSTTMWRIVHHVNHSSTHTPVFETVTLFATGLGVCLLRNHAVFAYLVMLLALVLFLWKKERLLTLAAVCVLPAFWLITGPLYSAIGVVPVDNVIESYSIPAQQIARVIHDGGDLREDELAMLANVVDVDRVAESYTTYISDPIKALVQEKDPSQTYLKEHFSELAALWLRVGMRNPQLYLQAWIDQTKGYWYPDVQFWVYHPLTSFDFAGVENAITARSLLPKGITYALDQFRESHRWLPGIGLLWSIGLAAWTSLFMLGLNAVKGRRRMMIPFLPALTITAALLLVTPVYAEFRYAYPLFVTLPLMCILPFDCPPQTSVSVKD